MALTFVKRKQYISYGCDCCEPDELEWFEEIDSGVQASSEDMIAYELGWRYLSTEESGHLYDMYEEDEIDLSELSGKLEELLNAKGITWRVV